MTLIVWIGPGRAPEAVQFCSLGGVAEFTTAAEAIAGDISLEVVIVAADGDDAPDIIRELREACPDAQILAASEGGLSAPLAAALGAGAVGAVELTLDPGVLAHRVHEASVDYLRASGERELLLRLRDLNEEFRRNVIALERPNMELTEQPPEP